jgi:ubiquinone/menaquinone biosynthesis C-methylase UbiE
VSIKQLVANKTEISQFWNARPCGSWLAAGAEPGSHEFFDRTEAIRYSREPFIKHFARFEEWKEKYVLEVGCGMGTDLSMFARHGAKTWGVDLTLAGASLAKQRLVYHRSTPRIMQADAENLPFPDGIFDLVYSWGVIHVTPDTVKAARELTRVARPGGRVVAMIYNRRSLVALQTYFYYGLFRGRIYRSLGDAIAAHLESPGMKSYTISEAHNLFEPLLDEIRVTPVVTPYDVRIAREHFLPEWVRTLVPSRLGYFLVIEGLKPAVTAR